MNLLQRINTILFWRYMKNNAGYSFRELVRFKNLKWLRKFEDVSLGFYWFKVELIKTNRCTMGWTEGQKIYFDNTGMLITRTCTKRVCPHAIAAVSPVIYSALDRIGRGADPSDIMIDHVACTDPGFDQNGLGNNLMKITFERMPAHSYCLNTLDMMKRILFASKEARGTNPGGLQ